MVNWYKRVKKRGTDVSRFNRASGGNGGNADENQEEVQGHQGACPAYSVICGASIRGAGQYLQGCELTWSPISPLRLSLWLLQVESYLKDKFLHSRPATKSRICSIGCGPSSESCTRFIKLTRFFCVCTLSLLQMVGAVAAQAVHKPQGREGHR